MKERLSPAMRFLVLGLIVVILPLGIGNSLAPRLVPAPKVGVMRFWTDIYYWTAQDAIEQLAYARKDPSIRCSQNPRVAARDRSNRWPASKRPK